MKESAFEFWAEIIKDNGLDHPSEQEMILGAYALLFIKNKHLALIDIEDNLNEWLTEFFNP